MKSLPFFLLLINFTAHAGLGTWLKGEGWHGNKQGQAQVSSAPPDYYSEYREDVRAALRNGKASGRSTSRGIVISNGSERIIENNKIGYDASLGFKTGEDFLNQVEYYGNKQCIPLLSVVSHGWGSSRKSGGNGIPVAESQIAGVGLYLDRATADAEALKSIDKTRTAEYLAAFKAKYKVVNKWAAEVADDDPRLVARVNFKLEAKRAKMLEDSKKYARTLDDLQAMLKKPGLFSSPKAKFCDRCVIQLYACNLGDPFAEKLLQVTGCQIIYSTGNMTGIDTQSGKQDHMWVSDSKDGNTRTGSLYALTPVKQGRSLTYSKQRILTSTKNPYDSHALWP